MKQKIHMPHLPLNFGEQYNEKLLWENSTSGAIFMREESGFKSEN